MPLTALTPILTPVKLPGPLLTAYRSMSSALLPEIFKTDSSIAISV